MERTIKILVTSSLAAAALGAATTPVRAADIKAGDWDLSVGGFINAYYTHVVCSGNQAINGPALGTEALGCGAAGQTGNTIIGNGLLPNALITTAKTKQEGIDIGATFMIGAATAAADQISDNAAVDVRQGFFTVGTAEAGTLKLGRDYGLYGSNPILGDMTLIGAGAPMSATQRNRVTLGHIGSGYTYLGAYGQIAYTTPAINGFSFTGAVMSPVDTSSVDPLYTSRSSPQLQAQATFSFTGGKVWVAGKHQQFHAVPETGGSDFTMSGGEIGGSMTFGPVGVLLNWEGGTGIGVLADGDTGDHRQDNIFAQVTFQATPKWKLGLNWGQSHIDTNVVGDLKSNQDWTGGVYYNLTKSVTLVGEYSETSSEPEGGGGSARVKGFAIGGIIFF
jgi:predicted porin